MQPEPNPEDVAVGARIRSVLEELGVSGNELSRRLGWPQSNVARRLLGKTPTTVPELTEIAAALDVPVAQLLPTDDRLTYAQALIDEKIASGELIRLPSGGLIKAAES